MRVALCPIRLGESQAASAAEGGSRGIVNELPDFRGARVLARRAFIVISWCCYRRREITKRRPRHLPFGPNSPQTSRFDRIVGRGVDLKQALTLHVLDCTGQPT